MYNISDVYSADRKPPWLMVKAGTSHDGSQQERRTLATLSEALKFFGLVPWPVGPLAFKDIGRAVRAAYSSPFVRCKNTQRLGRAAPWNSSILRALSARRTSGPGRNRISIRTEVKLSCVSFFQEVELRPSRWIIRSLGSDGGQGVAMAAKSLSSVMKVSKMEPRFCYDLQRPTLSWQIVEMHETVPQEWFE